MTGIEISNIPNPNAGRGIENITEKLSCMLSISWRNDTSKKMAFSSLNDEELSAWQSLQLDPLRWAMV